MKFEFVNNDSGRLAAQLPGPVAFVMGGGGSMGASQVGMLQALSEHHITADMVAGTSIGAINGAIVAADPQGAANRLSHLWNDLDDDAVLSRGLVRRIYTILRYRNHVYEARGLAELVEGVIGDLLIEQLSIPYAAVALDVSTSKAAELMSGPVGSAVLASAAIPGVFPPVERGGQTFYDGGLVNNVPISTAMRMGARSLVVMDCNFPDQALEAPKSVTDALFYYANVIAHATVDRDLPAAAELVPVLYLPGAKPRAMSPLDFSHTHSLMTGAYESTRAFLDTLRVNGPGIYRNTTSAVSLGPDTEIIDRVPTR